ncbi:MAG TPA: nucleotidyltransferase family protein [Thermoanaerobaculia bacterium]|nr:nucleotidyltransferase family protein [Thermoanaerobaculia bacterium]
MTRPIGGLILAAGGSSRMGRPKLLLEIGGEPMLARTVRIALEAGLRPVHVVLGSDRDALAAVLSGGEVVLVDNARWRDGLASSISCGIASFDSGTIRAVAILLADQPSVTAGHLIELGRRWSAGDDPVATDYEGRPGVPAIFGPRWLGQLAALQGDRGARELLERAGSARVAMPAPPADVDTPEDYGQLTSDPARE